LSSNSGPGAAPLVIVGVVVAYVTTQMLWGDESDHGRRRVASVEDRDHVVST
jgi:hypothetical protein